MIKRHWNWTAKANKSKYTFFKTMYKFEVHVIWALLKKSLQIWISHGFAENVLWIERVNYSCLTDLVKTRKETYVMLDILILPYVYICLTCASQSNDSQHVLFPIKKTFQNVWITLMIQFHYIIFLQWEKHPLRQSLWAYLSNFKPQHCCNCTFCDWLDICCKLNTWVLCKPTWKAQRTTQILIETKLIVLENFSFNVARLSSHIAYSRQGTVYNPSTPTHGHWSNAHMELPPLISSNTHN